MLIEIIIAILIGCTMGTITGVTPGIHINLISAILVSFLASSHVLQSFTLISLAVFITSMSITHTFIDFVPSVFLGAPEEDSFLSVLPGHQMLKQGKAHEAIVLSLYGSLIALLIIIFFVPIFIFAIPLISDFLERIMAFILVFASAYLILRDDSFVLAGLIFSLAGFLGFSALNLPVKEPLLVLLTGLFGSSALIVSIKNKTRIQKQKITPVKKIKISKKELFNSSLGAIISAPLSSFLPGMGAGHAAIIGSEFFRQSKKGFIVLLGAINTMVIGLSFVTLFVLGKTRTGSALAVKEIMEKMSLLDLGAIILTIVLSGIISFFMAIRISKLFARNIAKISYSKLSFFILLILIVVVLFFSNILGFLVFIIATSLGIFAILSGARRINLMGVLLVPTILFYLI